MTLDQQLAAFRDEFARTAPAGRVVLYEAKIEELRAAFAEKMTLGQGDRAPDFGLPDQYGTPVTLAGLLRRGPTVVTFYRGGWCPYCNIQLRAYQSILPDIMTLGGGLVAISPQLPDQSLATADADNLTFDVLSDVGNHVARSFGLVFSLPEEIRAVLESNNKSLLRINGDGSWELPVPATYVIGRDGIISLAYIEVDYRKRLEPACILEALRALGEVADNVASYRND